MLKIIPPNFGYVEENIYRSGIPSPQHFFFLSTLNLRTCIFLQDNVDDIFLQWLRDRAVTIVNPLGGISIHPIDSIGKANMSLSEVLTVNMLKIILDTKTHPLLITCAMGRYRTGILCGCLRKLQGWNLVSILEEYRRFAGQKTRVDNEEFVELFDPDLVDIHSDNSFRSSVIYSIP